MSDNKKTPPGIFQKGWNLASTLTAYVGSGFMNATAEEYQQRLEICDPCEFRDGNRCAKCGCFLAAKAAIKISYCPEDKWPNPEKVEEEKVQKRPYIITDEGYIHGELAYGPPEGWIQVTVGHWAPPWGPCRHRRTSKKYAKRPEIIPFCLLTNEHVTVETCLKCDVREP